MSRDQRISLWISAGGLFLAILGGGISATWAQASLTQRVGEVESRASKTAEKLEKIDLSLQGARESLARIEGKLAK